MTALRLVLKGLWRFRAIHLATAAGMAVATAILAGALLVGDSVRGSLRRLATERLGPADYALVAPGFFDDSLGRRLAEAPDSAGHVASAVAGIFVQGGAGADGSRAADVSVFALSDWLVVPPGECVLNGVLADALGVTAGESVVLRLPAIGELPADAVLAHRARDETVTGLRLTVRRVARGRDLAGAFSLAGGQRPGRLAWVNLGELQSAIGQRGRANLLLVSGRDGAIDKVSDLNALLSRVATLNDYGLAIGERRTDLSGAASAGPETRGRLASGTPPASQPDRPAILSSRNIYLPPAAVEAADAAAEALSIRPQRVAVYLLNHVQRLDAAGQASRPGEEGPILRVPPSPPGRWQGEGQTTARPKGSARAPESQPSPRPSPLQGNGESHYVVAAGLTDPPGGPLDDDQVALNAWLADRLGAKVGDRIRFSFYRRQDDGALGEVSNESDGLSLRVGRIVPTGGLGADPSLAPDFPGLTDKASIADWRPPAGVVIDRKLVTEADEEYWRTYRAAPKLFVSLATARRLWRGPFGELTSIRLPAEQAGPFAAELRRRLPPGRMGLEFTALKVRQLAASAGSSDFAGLFIGFSMFLIVSAALLVALLFRLGVEQRARQFGLLGALGFSRRRLVGLAVSEGAALAIIGAAAGLIGAVGYTWLMMLGLRTWWYGAVGTTALDLFVSGKTLALGLIAGLLVALAAVAWGAWRVGRVAPVTLLAGGWETGWHRRRRGGGAGLVGLAGVILALGLFVLSAVGLLAAQWAFLGGGAVLLISVLCLLAATLRPRAPSPLPLSQRERGKTVEARLRGGSVGLARLGVRNAGRHLGRSVLTVGLLAFASFVLVIVSAMRQGPPADPADRSSGTGGFALILQAAIPLLGDLNTPDGRKLLGISPGDEPAIWSGAKFYPLRRRGGQDISCLNITRPDSPTILGVSEDLIGRGGFARGPNPLEALNKKPDDGAIPVIADAATADYILHLKIGDTLQVSDQFSSPKRLRLAATLTGSIFQSELLMSESNFRRLFPSVSGAGVVLIECRPADAAALQRLLNSELADYAVSVDRTADRLASYAEVANTYLSTFATLGALGMLLGTIGLAVVLLRGLAERRSELALLAAVGFSQARRLGLVLAENALLLVLGLLAGLTTALVGVAPVLWGGRQSLNILSLALTLAVILLVGLAVLAVALLIAGRRFTPADLRRE